MIDPNRPDPMDASGWSKYCEERSNEAEACGNDPLWSALSTNDPDDEHKRRILNLCHQMETEQDEEDTAMLIRLVKIRHSLWT